MEPLPTNKEQLDLSKCECFNFEEKKNISFEHFKFMNGKKKTK